MTALHVAATERVLDARAWHGIERGYRALQGLRRRSARPRPLARDLVVRALEREGPVGELVAALDAARDAGAFAIAERLAAKAEPRLAELDRPARAGLLSVLGELRLAVGDRVGARDLALEHFALLAQSPRGATFLDVSGTRPGLVPWLPNGRVNGYALARALAEGKLDGPELLGVLSRRPWIWLTNPNAHLLAFNAFVADDPERAARFLSRFLHAYDLPACRVEGTAGDLLSRIRFAPAEVLDNGPLVSIIMTAFNAASTIEYAVDSLLAQTYRSLEILVADDASTDATPAILQTRYGKNDRVRVFRSSTNQGTYNLRNALSERARGSYVTFHDADDLALPARIERQVKALSSDADRVACTTSNVRMTASGRIVFFRDQAASRLAIVSLMMKRTVYDQLAPYRSVRFGADLELYQDLRARFAPERIVRLREPLLIMLSSEASLTRASDTQSLEDGYRSPARRAYSELVFRKHCPGSLRASEEEIGAALAEAGIVAAPAPVEEISA